ncbi:fungal hydrophobin [Phanerochaete sordida]|uniref:Hydrophobin n=1 Tax=Phanerochaete sordida TaxID=48140 RepID=A0A9P3GRX0_9APHY|nr:fungal hydrophobin [Phanerochaete sordida]
MKFTAASLLALPLLAVATPLEVRQNTCSTGTLQCCQSTESSTSSAANLLAGLLGIVFNAGELVGQSCSPITVIDVGGSDACKAQAVCCTNNNVGGLISIGCIPVEL